MTDTDAARKALARDKLATLMSRHAEPRYTFNAACAEYIRNHGPTILAALSEREGFVMVPKILTKAMEEAGESALDDIEDIGVRPAYVHEVWEAMLSAAPGQQP